ncbi:MAG: hypothetical protein AAF804_09420 [Bacteroidota bacterium]
MTYKVLLENPHLFGLKLDEATMYEPITYRSIRVKESIADLAGFAKEHGTTVDKLRAFNPWLIANSLQVKKGKMYEIRIPVQPDFMAPELEVQRFRIALPEAEELLTDSTQSSVDSVLSSESLILEEEEALGSKKEFDESKSTD